MSWKMEIVKIHTIGIKICYDRKWPSLLMKLCYIGWFCYCLFHITWKKRSNIYELLR